MNTFTCYIMGAGECCAGDLKPQAGDLVIAADGGYQSLLTLDIVPDWVVGDFDSLPQVPDRSGVVRLPKEKDDTDMLAAIRIGIEQGFVRFVLYGGTGGRIDHTIANFQCLKWLSAQGCSGMLRGHGWTAQVVSNGTIALNPEGYVSVFSMGERVEGVCLRGLKYPLEDAILTDIFPIGVSNESTGAPCRISVAKGTLLVIYDDSSGGTLVL